MGLREQAALDCQMILNDTEGFAGTITITNPEGICGDLNGLSVDISQLIDPDTGQSVSGRKASVALHLKDLRDLDCFVDYGIPFAVSDQSSKPWVIEFDDHRGNVHKFKVNESNPDRTLDLVTCTLEVYAG